MTWARISFFILFLATILCPRPAHSAPVASISDDLRTQCVTFTTKDGPIQVQFPSDIQAGDTISGTIFFHPKGRDEREQQKYEDDMNSYVVQVVDQAFETRMGDFVVEIPKGTSGSFTCSLKDKHKTTIGKQEVVLKDKVPQAPRNCCAFSPILQCGTTFPCWGAFDGNLQHVSFNVGGRELTKVSSSPRCVVVEVPTDLVGKRELEIITPTFSLNTRVNCVRAEVSIADPKIERGRSTTATIVVHGLNGLRAPVAGLVIKNTSPGVVSMDGGDSQTIEMKTDSGWQFTRNIRGLRSGAFSICAWLLDPPTLPNFAVQPSNEAWLRKQAAAEGQ